MAEGFKVVRRPSPAQVEQARAVFGQIGPDLLGQYENCVLGGERGRAVLYHLIEEATGAIVGFMGFETTVEDLGIDYPANAWLSFEYVFLLPSYRGIGLAKKFRLRATKRAKRWLERLMGARGTRFTVMSGSTPVSSEGALFVRKFNRELRGWCQTHGLRMQPPDLDP